MNTRSRLNPHPGLLPSVDAGIDGGGGGAPPAQTTADANGVWANGIVPASTPAVQQIPVPTSIAALRDPATGQFTKEVTDALEQARREERDKMHGRLTTMDDELRVLRDERQARLDAAAAADKAAQEAAEAARQAELTAVQRVQEIEIATAARIAAMEADLARRDALQLQEERFQQLAAYRIQRIAQEGVLIMPQLAQHVVGNSEQEIEQSISAVKAETEDIVQMFGDNGVAYRQQQRGVSPTGQPPVGPMDSTSGQRTISAEEIGDMDPATYAANRPALMAAARQSGPYGRR